MRNKTETAIMQIVERAIPGIERRVVDHDIAGKPIYADEVNPPIPHQASQGDLECEKHIVELSTAAGCDDAESALKRIAVIPKEESVAQAWHAADELPPDSRSVLVELKPSRKNSKTRDFVVASYFREKKGEHDAQSDWFDSDGDEIDVLRWQYIIPFETQ